MPWTFDEFYSDVESTVGSIFSGLRSGLGSSLGGANPSTNLSTLLSPVYPYNRSSILTPIVAAVGVATMVVLSAAAIGGLTVTVAAMMALFYLLTEVFGYELELAPFTAPGR